MRAQKESTSNIKKAAKEHSAIFLFFYFNFFISRKKYLKKGIEERTQYEYRETVSSVKTV